MTNIDKKFRIVEANKDQTIVSTSSYTEVYTDASINSKSYLFGIVFNVSSDKVYLRLTIDNNNVIDEVLLDDLTKDDKYRMPKDFAFDFPISPLSDTSFVIKFPGGIQYGTMSLSFKKQSNGNKTFEAGMISYYDN